MNIEQLYRDFGIPYATEGHKHTRDGWINIACPFCTGNAGLHLGFHLEDEYYVCWRCGGHSITDTLAKVLNMSYKEIPGIIRQYSGKVVVRHTKEQKVRLKAFKLPEPLLPDFTAAHINYLIRRGFDPDEIKQEWKVQASGMYCKLDKLDFKWRLIIPIYWNGKIVNFQGRDITDKAPQKYLACPEERELINIKKTLYGQQQYWHNLGIGVEGVTDVWKIGRAGVGLYGVKYKPTQVRLIAKQFKRFFVLFDPDRAGQTKARQLVAELRFRGVEAYNYKLPEEVDPGSLSYENARVLVKELKTYKIS
jgi:5S rRNA maturation endonuclease (ribonuclease M5)